jgi:hypothetical protein
MKIFKYKGKRYIVSEVELGLEFKSCKIDINGYTRCIINKALSRLDKQRELHRLVTGRRLRGAMYDKAID